MVAAVLLDSVLVCQNHKSTTSSSHTAGEELDPAVAASDRPQRSELLSELSVSPSDIRMIGNVVKDCILS